jgi:hypothetical protein
MLVFANSEIEEDGKKSIFNFKETFSQANLKQRPRHDKK